MIKLNRISLINFKNYPEASIEFCGKINCFIGNNGVGKTNLLDAIYYLSFTKSFLSTTDNFNIHSSKDFFLIKGVYEITDNQSEISCGYKDLKKKSFKKDNKEYTKLADHIGFVPLIIATPYDAKLINFGPEERRKFIDQVISQYNKQYLSELMNYNKVLMQRNKLLKDISFSGYHDDTTLDIYNEQLAKYGSYIYNQRALFIKEINPLFQEYYNKISLKRESVSLEYQSKITPDNYLTELKANYNKDIAAKHTTTGIHKDDLSFNINSFPLKKAGSQGQQKSYLIALKLAQFEYIKNISNKTPLLLLDDIFDKLDEDRVTQIIKLTGSESFGQIFITDANKTRLETILKRINSEYKVFYIDEHAQISCK